MDEKPTIDQEARRLDLHADERDVDRAFSITQVVIGMAMLAWSLSF